MLIHVEARYPLAMLKKQGTLFVLSFHTDSLTHSRIPRFHFIIPPQNIKGKPHLPPSPTKMAGSFQMLLCIFMILASGAKLNVNAVNLTLVNQCKETIWPGIITQYNNQGEGFTLKAGQTTFYNVPDGWSGRIWARTGCSFDKNDSNASSTCQTGDCGPSVNCTSPGNLPVTIAELTLGVGGLIDFYDVSLVDGFNVPIVVKPANGKGNCSTAGCDGDLRNSCPSELAVKSNGTVTACRSSCEVFNTDEYCCRGPMTCLPTNYSRAFKQACPVASSYGGDILTVTCSATEYILAFL